MAYKLQAINQTTSDFECTDEDYHWLMYSVGFSEISGLDPVAHEGYWVCEADCRHVIKKVDVFDITTFYPGKQSLLKEFKVFIQESGGFKIFLAHSKSFFTNTMGLETWQGVYNTRLVIL